MHDIRTEFFVRVSCTSFLDGELGSSVMGLTQCYLDSGEDPDPCSHFCRVESSLQVDCDAVFPGSADDKRCGRLFGRCVAVEPGRRRPVWRSELPETVPRSSTTFQICTSFRTRSRLVTRRLACCRGYGCVKVVVNIGPLMG